MLLLFGTNVTQVGEYKSRDREKRRNEKVSSLPPPKISLPENSAGSILPPPPPFYFEKNEKLDQSKFEIRKIGGRLRK